MKLWELIAIFTATFAFSYPCFCRVAGNHIPPSQAKILAVAHNDDLRGMQDTAEWLEATHQRRIDFIKKQRALHAAAIKAQKLPSAV